MMELSKFPLDEQVCTMEIASCKYLATSVGFYITLSGHKNAIKWVIDFCHVIFSTSYMKPHKLKKKCLAQKSSKVNIIER